MILANHWAWGSFAEGAVTLLGIAAAAKGAALIAVPELTLKSPKTVGASLLTSAAGFTLWGGWLCWVGWGG